MTGMRKAALTALAAVAIVGAALPASGSDVTISGDVVYRERMLLPAGAEARVTLEDVSLADAPSTVIAETTVPARTSPTPFELSYPADALLDGQSYALRASISLAGRLMFTTTTHHAFDPATTERIALLVQRVADEPDEADAPAIVGAWRAEEIGGQGVIDSVASTLTVEADGTVSGRGGCNLYRGSATISGDAITFGSLAATLMACAEEVSGQERRFFDALAATAAWHVDAETGRLHLADADGVERLVLVAN